jgi:hypothetical protein
VATFVALFGASRTHTSTEFTVASNEKQSQA